MDLISSFTQHTFWRSFCKTVNKFSQIELVFLYILAIHIVCSYLFQVLIDMAPTTFCLSKWLSTNRLRSEIFHRKCAIRAPMCSATLLVKVGVNKKRYYTKFSDNHYHSLLVEHPLPYGRKATSTTAHLKCVCNTT